jgi:hypothetical protein
MKLIIKTMILLLLAFAHVLTISPLGYVFAKEESASPIQSFFDIPSGHWAEEAILAMARAGVINGIGESVNGIGKFDPNGLLTRAQFIAMIVRAVVDPSLWKYSEGRDWSYGFIETARAEGLLAPWEFAIHYLYDDEFGGFDKNISRAELALLLMRAATYSDRPLAIDPNINSDYSADYSGHIYRDAIELCYANNIVKGVDETGIFEPYRLLTRAEGVTAFHRLLQIKRVEQDSPILMSIKVPEFATVFVGDTVEIPVTIQNVNGFIGFEADNPFIITYPGRDYGDLRTYDFAGSDGTFNSIITGISTGVTDITYITLYGQTAVCRVTVQEKQISSVALPTTKSIVPPIEFKWYYRKAWSWKLPLSDDPDKRKVYDDLRKSYYDYDDFRGEIIKYYGYEYFVTLTVDDEYMRAISEDVASMAKTEGYSEQDVVNLVIAFVQSLEYVPDVTTGYDEYPKFPYETLYDHGGDCEDMSILLASLLRELNYDVVLIGLPSHMAVGLRSSLPLPGRYYDFNGGRYYYIETTAEGFGIGEMPEKYVDGKAQILTI